MKKFKTYLAGAFAQYKKYPDWRDYVLREIKNKRIEFYDPRTASRQLCPASFTMDDANGVLDSDIIFHYKMRGCEDDGASWEHGIGFACNLLLQRNPNIKIIKPKLIIYADETAVPFPLHFGSANVTFSDLEISVEFLNSLKSLGKMDFMKDYLRLLDFERAGGEK